MTLPPIDSWQVKGVAGPKYKVGPKCANPTCGKWAEHAHHMWRRSALGRPYDWVQLPDDSIVGNLVGLCPDCHDLITGRLGGHKAAIRLAVADLVDNRKTFWWCLIGNGSGIRYEFVAPLEPQPPTQDSLIASPANEAGSDVSCPTCGQPRARRRSPVSPSGRRRVRKTWPVKVPADAEENGADVLDEFVEDLAPLLGVEPDKRGGYGSGRYYVLVPVLYYASLHKHELIEMTAAE
jgi:hypothetical protein